MKKIFKSIVFLFLFSVSFFATKAQNREVTLLQKEWKAFWISVPDAPTTGYGVYMFRKNLELSEVPKSFVFHISADNRYKLFVNEKFVALGPARGDLTHWNFETVDIASYLNAGKNIIAVQVWNDGEFRQEAQISLRTGLIVQGAGEKEKIINTDNTWKCQRDSSYSPTKFIVSTYYVAGPGELVNMNFYEKNWQSLSFDNSNWKNAEQIFHGAPKNILGAFGTPSGWLLVPSSIPQPEMKREKFLVERQYQPEDKKHFTYDAGNSRPIKLAQNTSGYIYKIETNTDTTILLDQTYLTNAYLTFIFNGGKDAGISLSYAEALYTKFPKKENRNEVIGKTFLGRKDSIISNGTDGQIFSSLSFRTYRYVKLRIVTKNSPLEIQDIYGIFTGYPFQLNASLNSDNTEMNKILEIGWRTARLCAIETYMDCPYYEQLQYIGDSRIQGLVSLYNSGDDRLLKNALNFMDYSRQPEGVTLSRHPSLTPQYIPTFSLWYIGMLHDYCLYRNDLDFIKSKLGGARQILNYFKNFQQQDGSLKDVPQWMFTDWVNNNKGWIAGVGPMSTDGSSALLDLQLLWAYQIAADLENKIGIKDLATLYANNVEQLKKTIREKYWDNNRKLFSDRTEKDFFSQHANALAILTGLIEQKDLETFGNKIIADTTLAPASIYFKYYLHQALVKAGLGNDYLKWLDKWRENISMGMTTWGEDSDVNTTRSDCHAWGASPNIEFYRTVLGIDSDAFGFSKVKIEPHLGDIKNISGKIPHPNGTLSVSYKLDVSKWRIEISLPKNTTGVLIWKGKQFPLKVGLNMLTQ